MGRPKPLLFVGPDRHTFVRILASSLAEGGVPDALVVGRPEDEALIAELVTCAAAGLPIRFVPNPDADRGQLSSVLAGLNAADRPGVRGILVTPVDAPLIRSSTIRTIVQAFESSHMAIVRATYRGRHGHPVVFSRAVFDELRHADPDVGAKAVVRAHAAAALHDVLNVEVDDPGVVQDVDDPDDYARLKLNAP